MITYRQRYENIKKMEADFIEDMLSDMALKIATIWVEPKVIGNMVYYYVEENGKKVPAYCYLSDYKKGEGFKPIYDRNGRCEFGWHYGVVNTLDNLRKKMLEDAGFMF